MTRIDHEIQRLKDLAESAKSQGDSMRVACLTDLRDRAIDARDYGIESGDDGDALASVQRLAKQAETCGQPGGG